MIILFVCVIQGIIIFGKSRIYMCSFAEELINACLVISVNEHHWDSLKYISK